MPYTLAQRNNRLAAVGLSLIFFSTTPFAFGAPIDKMLIEYKTAKSSLGRAIDGNAHERLSFQIMQYLEVATTYTSCSLTVLTNGAFSRYRNKYHVNFHIQADRLSALPWFSMDHLCTREEFSGLARRLASWLFENDT